MESWHNERNLLLNAWPVALVRMGADSGTQQSKDLNTINGALFDLALACTDEAGWLNWLGEVDKHWPLDLEKSRDLLSQALGGILVDSIHLLKRVRLDEHHDASGLEPILRAHLGVPSAVDPPRLSYDPGLEDGAWLLCEQFRLGGVEFWAHEVPRAKQRLTELRLALGALATACGTENARIGRGKLVLVVGADIRVPRVSGNRIDLPATGLGLARGWCQWRLENADDHQILEAERSWARQLPTGVRGTMARQRAFLTMTQNALRQLAGGLVDRSNAGELALRRYRAASRWMDDLGSGPKDSDTLMRGWRKIKTGNRIAWTGLTGNGASEDLQGTIDNWQWEDRALEAAFWRAPQWQVPAWFQRFLALGSDAWPEHMELVRGPLLHQAWAFAFEGMIRNRLGHDSGAAKKRASHPLDHEAHQMERFLTQHLNDAIFG